MSAPSAVDLKQEEEQRNAMAPAPAMPLPPAPANPALLGFFSLATTTLMVGLFVIQARGVTALSMLIGQVTIVGGLGMLISGILCHQQGAHFAATAFGMYGLFYMSFGVVLYPDAGANTGYATTAENNNALGLYLITWFVLSLVMWPVTWRLNVGLAVLFTLVVFYFLFLSIGFMASNTTIITIGGYFGILVGTWGYILGMEALYGVEDAIVKLPNPALARKAQ